MHAKRRAWAVMATVFVASVVIAVNRFKVPPVLPELMDDLHVGMVGAGWLMSAVSLASLLLAIPGAFLLMRLSFKITGLIALGSCLVGTVGGALAPNPEVLLLARVAEGIGLGLIAVVAPATISAWFEPGERGLPMGIWASWVPVGNVIVFNVAPRLLRTWGWQSVWWFGAALTVLTLVLYALVVDDPPDKASASDPKPRVPGKSRRMLFNRSTWILGLAFGAFGFCLIAYNTWAPTYLVSTLHVSTASASLYASLMFLAAIPASVIAGGLVNRAKQRYLLLVVFFLLTCVLFVWSFRLGSVAVAVAYMLLLGFVSNFIPTTTFTLAPETVPSLAYAGLALGVVMTGSQVGALTGPPVLGAVVNGGDWIAGGWLLVGVMAGGTLLAVVGWRSARARSKAVLPG